MQKKRQVRVIAIPPGLPDDDLQTRAVFEKCIGQTFEVVGEQDDLLELEVGAVMGVEPHIHSIWIEEAYTDASLIEVRLSGKMLGFVIEAIEYRIAGYNRAMDDPTISEDDLADMSNDRAVLRAAADDMIARYERWKEA
jgi:hypothetical protein